MNASVNDNAAAVLGWLDGQRDAMVALLRDIVNIDSGTYNKAGVDRVGAVLRAHLEAGGVACEVIPHERFGGAPRPLIGLYTGDEEIA